MGIIEQVKQIKLDEAARAARKDEAGKMKHLFVTSLLTNTSHSVAKVAGLAGVSEAFVNRVKASLKK